LAFSFKNREQFDATKDSYSKEKPFNGESPKKKQEEVLKPKQITPQKSRPNLERGDIPFILVGTKSDQFDNLLKNFRSNKTKF
jgi:GTPase SAR1 family protein